MVISVSLPISATPSLLTGMNQTLKSDVEMGHIRNKLSSSTPEYLKEALGMKKPKHSRSSSNGEHSHRITERTLVRLGILL